MSDRIPTLLMGDILTAINRIKSYTQNMDFDAFSQDSKTIDAMVRNFEIIGEAANKISAEINSLHHSLLS